MFLPSDAQFFDRATLDHLGPPLGFDARGHEIDIRADAVDRMARCFHKNIHDGALRLEADAHKGRTDAGVATDAAEVFFTSFLEQMLATISKPPSSTEIMTGADPVLPIKSTLMPGAEALVWDVEIPTGQAQWVEPEGMGRINQVGEFCERQRQRAHYSGIGYGYGLIETWRQALRPGASLDVSRAATARETLRRFNERVLLFGAPQLEIGGLLANGASYVCSLNANFGSLVANPDAVQQLLQAMEHRFDRIAQSHGGRITGVLAPKTDSYALQRLRNDDGDFVWPELLAMHEWLGLIEWVDGLQTAASGGGPLWVAWSDSEDELWSELSPVPMVYGPFTDNNLRTSWVLLTHCGGVVVRRRERLARFEFPA